MWPDGTAAQAARQKTAEVRAEASNSHEPCQRISRALREHADTIRSLKHMLDSIMSEATAAGYVVNLAAGTVSASAHLLLDSSEGRYLAQAITSYVHQLDGILDRAAESDQKTASAINENLPDIQTGFGASSGPALTAAGLQEQNRAFARSRYDRMAGCGVVTPVSLGT